MVKNNLLWLERDIIYIVNAVRLKVTFFPTPIDVSSRAEDILRRHNHTRPESCQFQQRLPGMKEVLRKTGFIQCTAREISTAKGMRLISSSDKLVMEWVPFAVRKMYREVLCYTQGRKWSRRGTEAYHDV